MLNFPTAFQAEDEGSIPFTRSNLFNDLRGVRQLLCHAGLLFCVIAQRSQIATCAKKDRRHTGRIPAKHVLSKRFGHT